MRGSLFRVVIAFPSDMSDEADIVCKVIEEINGWMTDTRAVTLQPVRWTENAWPGVGADAQDVINRQFPQDFELLVMLMGTRLGTPTGRADSGTVEEFERAFKRLKSGERVKIFAYFSDRPISPSTLDLEQLQKVQSFKKDVQSRGVLTFAIKDSASFEKDFRKHIMHELEDWGSSAVKPSVKPKNVLSERDIQGGTSPSYAAVRTASRTSAQSIHFRRGTFQDPSEASLEDIIREIISIESQSLGLQVFLDQRFTEMMQMSLFTETGINPAWAEKSNLILKAVERFKTTVGGYTRQLQGLSKTLVRQNKVSDNDVKRLENITYRIEEIINTNEDIVASLARFPEFNQDDKVYRSEYDEIRRLANTRLGQALINLRSLK